MEKFDSLSGKIPIKPLYFGSKQHTSLIGESRDYNSQNFTIQTLIVKVITNWVWRFQTKYLSSLKVDTFFRVYKQRKENDI